MMDARSLVEAPRASNDLTSRSSDTVGSPASIFATRDWLECTAFASSVCVSPFALRRARRPSASFKRSSTYADSSSVRLSSAFGVPTFQPFASRRLRFSARIVILLKAFATSVDHSIRGCACLLPKYIENHNSVGIYPVHDAPANVCVANPKFVTPPADARHGPRMRHGKSFASLQAAQQITSLDSRSARHRGRFDLPV